MNIKIDQHYYTSSCIKGGLSTLDNSEGLSQEEILKIENFIIYNPPLGLLSIQEKSDIQKLFPKNISFFKLNNRFVYLHSTYTGRSNHTPHRFGNFFSHSIILEENTVPEFYAVNILPPSDRFLTKMAESDYKPFSFKLELRMDEDVAYMPSLMQTTLSIDNTPLIVDSFFFSFCDFLNDSNRMSIFARIIDWIAESWFSTRGNNITICDTKENLQDWVLAIDFFLPRVIANQISFASYVDHPSEVKFQITGIIPENQIDGLGPKHKYVDTSRIMNYSLQNTSFAAYLKHCIQQRNLSAWKLASYVTDKLKLKEFKSLNLLSLYIDFRENIDKRTSDDYVFVWNSLEKDQLLIPDEEIDVLIKKAQQSDKPLMLTIIKKALERHHKQKGYDYNSFSIFHQKIESESPSLIGAYVDIYLLIQKNSRHESKAAFDILTDESLITIRRERDIRVKLLQFADGLLDRDEEIDLNLVYHSMLKTVVELGLIPQDIPPILRSTMSNKIMRSLLDNKYYILTFSGFRKKGYDVLFKKISEILLEHIASMVSRRKYGSYELFFEEFYGDTDNMLNEVLKGTMIYKKKEFWPYFFSYYKEKANPQLPNQEFLVTVFILVLFSMNIKLADVGIVYPNLKLSESEIITISLLAKGIAGSNCDLSEINSFKTKPNSYNNNSQKRWWEI